MNSAMSIFLMTILVLFSSVNAETVGTIVLLGDRSTYTASSVFNLETSVYGKVLLSPVTIRKTTTTGLIEFKVPVTSNFGSVRQRVALAYILGRGADGKCTLPKFDINTATESTSAYQYCSNAYYNRSYRHCRRILFWTRCSTHYICTVASAIRIVPISKNMKYMKLTGSLGNFHLCGFVPTGDRAKISAAMPGVPKL